MPSLLELADDLPIVTLRPGEVLCAEGAAGGAVWVLESGRLAVTKDGARVNTVDRPGALVGEMALLLDGAATATVVAETVVTVRHAEDGAAFLRRHPDIAVAVATGLARRLDLVTTYLADLRHQYGAAPGIAMVGDVLAALAADDRPPARPGSARDPDPEY